MHEIQSVMKDPKSDLVIKEDAIAKVKKIRCIDPKHAAKCRWATQGMKYCRRRNYANRIPVMLVNDQGEDTICECFKVGKPGCKL